MRSFMTNCEAYRTKCQAYRASAEACVKLAEKVSDPFAKAALLNMAEG